MAALPSAFRIYLIVSILFVSASLCSIYRVDPSASSGGDGSSWSDAINSLDIALATATLSIDEIWLKGGATYIPSSPVGRDDCFLANYDVKIYGGFDGSESSIDSRKTTTAPSIISGDIGIENDMTDNCYHVLEYTEILRLDNVILQHGYAANYNEAYTTDNKPYATQRYGGALMTTDTTKRTLLELNNVIIRNNTAVNGGALFFAGSAWIYVHVLIKDSLFEYNRAIKDDLEGGYGGAIYEYFEPNITIINTEFNSNFAELRGGAIYEDYGAFLNVHNCTFKYNRAEGWGGAIFSEDRNSQTDGTFPRVISSTFSHNEASVGGGGILWYNNVNGTLTNNVFTSNSAPEGSAILLISSTAISNGNTYTDNALENRTMLQYTGIEDSLQFDLDSELSDLYSKWETKQTEWDIYPFNDTDTLCYVDIDAGTTGNGESWDTAFNDIQMCLDLLMVFGGEVWVKTGTYVPTTAPEWKHDDGFSSNMYNSYELFDNIRMYGGFDGTETSRYQRNWSDNPTYLSCQINDMLQCRQLLNAADNTIVDGFVFTAAGGGMTEVVHHDGGGSHRRLLSNQISEDIVLSSKYYSSALITIGHTIHVVNSIFHKIWTNEKGGAVYCTGLQEVDGVNKSPKFTNVAFLGNRAKLRGGAISADVNCHFTCDTCKFESNGASYKGGAIYLDFECNPTFIDATFIDNIAQEAGGCIAADGGSLVTFYGESTFTSNIAEMEGACLYAGSGVSPTTEQGFVFSDYAPVFSKNHMDNELNIGHTDIYGWPFCTIDTCSGIPPAPTRIPTPGPTTDVHHGDKQPNIIFFFIDDMIFAESLTFCAPDDGSHYQDSPIPNIDAFMSQSVLFTSAYCAAPMCTPSRFSLLTGRQASRSEFAIARSVVRDSRYYGATVSVPDSKMSSNDSSLNIPYILKNNAEQPYYTGFLGKWHLLQGSKCTPLSDSVDATLYEECQEAVSRQGFDFVDALYPENINSNEYFSHNPEWMVSQAQKFIDEAIDVQNKPFFMLFSPTLTHTPDAKDSLQNFDYIQTPKGNLTGDDIPDDTTMEERGTIWSEASTSVESNVHSEETAAGAYWVDNCFGALMNYLKDKDVYDNTFVVLMNDQGMGAKGTLFQGGTRTFKFIRYPPLFGDNGPYVMPSDFVVSFVDLASTIFELTKIDPPQTYTTDGVSWLQPVIDIINDENDDENTKFKYRYIDMDNSHAIVSSEYQYIYRMIHEESAQWTRSYPYYDDDEQLYDLRLDPSQQSNQINNQSLATVIITFQELMRAYIEDICTIDECKMPPITMTHNPTPSPSVEPTPRPSIQPTLADESSGGKGEGGDQSSDGNVAVVVVVVVVICAILIVAFIVYKRKHTGYTKAIKHMDQADEPMLSVQ